MKETDVKYLAGLLDADGHFGLEFNGNKMYLRITLSAAESIDQHGFIHTLPSLTGFGRVRVQPRPNQSTWATVWRWSVASRRDLEMLVPRLLKHLVIKGRHLQRLYNTWQENRGRVLTDLEVEQFKAYVKVSRMDAGSIKPKKHPTIAWVAGYLDGDGSYIFSFPPSYKSAKLLVQATAHENDRVGLELLYKAFGGRIETRGKTAPHILDWRHSLGIRSKSFAVKFLSKMVKHTRLKKHKIEQILAYINNDYSRTRTD